MVRSAKSSVAAPAAPPRNGTRPAPNLAIEKTAIAIGRNWPKNRT
jgi:hypothetical protein